MCAEGKKVLGQTSPVQILSLSSKVFQYIQTEVSSRRSLLPRSLSLSPLLLRKPPRSVRMLSLHSVAGNKKSTYDSAQQNLESTGEKEAEWVEKCPELQINTRLRLRNSVSVATSLKSHTSTLSSSSLSRARNQSALLLGMMNHSGGWRRNTGSSCGPSNCLSN